MTLSGVACSWSVYRHNHDHFRCKIWVVESFKRVTDVWSTQSSMYLVHSLTKNFGALDLEKLMNGAFILFLPM